jgi:hypothetical protein
MIIYNKLCHLTIHIDEAIKSKLLAIANRKIAHDNYVANNPTSAEPKSQQDFISVVHPELEGGSGNLAHTNYDLGIESKAAGDGPSIVKYRKTRAKKLDRCNAEHTTYNRR